MDKESDKMLAEYERVIKLLQKCQTNQVAESEKQIKLMATDDVQILTCLQQALKDNNLPQSLKLLSSSVINSIFVSPTQYNQKFCYNFFTSMLIDSNIEEKYKNELSRALMVLIDEADPKLLEQWRQFSLQCLCNNQLHRIGLIMLTVFSCSDVKKNVVEDLEEDHFQFSMRKLICTIQLQGNLKQILFYLSSWKTVIDYLIHFSKEYYPLNQLFKAMSRNQDFIKVLIFVYKTLSTGEGSHFLFLNLQHMESEDIQDIKETALDIHYMLLVKSLQKKKDFEGNLLYEFTGINIEIFINSLCYAAHKSIDDYDIDSQIVSMIQIVRFLIQFSPQITCKSWKFLLHCLLFPLMEVTQEQLIDFEENTSSFMEVSQDICENQKMGLIKTEISGFLQRIADLSNRIQHYRILYYGNQQSYQPEQFFKLQENQNLIQKYIINFCIASIKHRLEMQFISQAEGQIQFGYKQIKPLTLQSAFMILTLFSYCLTWYRKELEQIKIILCNHRVSMLPPLERSRLYVFLSYNYDDIFKGENQLVSIGFWVSKALQQQSHPTVVYCAMDFVNNSFGLAYNQTIVNTIIQKIPTVYTSNFWSLIKKLIYQFIIKMQQQTLILLIKKCYIRINIQIERERSKQVKMTYVISCLLQIIRIIMERSQCTAKMFDLKKIIWQVTNLYPTGVAYCFDEEIVKIVNVFLYTATPQEIQLPELQYFKQQFIEHFRANQYQYTYHFVAFNHFIMKGNLQNTVFPIFKVLKQSLQHFLGSLQNPRPQAQRKKMPIAHTLLVLQNIIALHGANISGEQLSSLSDACKYLYPIKNQTEQSTEKKAKLRIYDRALLARAFNLQLLCHIYKPHPDTISTLRKYHDLNIYFGYDVSVLLSCIKIQIFKQKEIANIVELIQIITRVLYLYIKLDTEIKIDKINEYQKSLKKGQKQQQQFKIEQETSTRDEKKKSSLALRIKRNNDYEHVLSFIETPFLDNKPKVLGQTKNVKNVDEIRSDFIDMLKELRLSNPYFFQSLILGLSNQIKQKLKVATQLKVQEILGPELLVRNKNGVRKIFKIKNIKLVSSNISNQNEKESTVEDFEQKVRRKYINYEDDDDQGEEKQLLKWQKADKKRRQKKKQQ